MSDEPQTSEDAQRLLVQLQEAKQALHHYEAEVRTIQTALIAEMQDSGTRKAMVDRILADGKLSTTIGTLTEPVSVVIDEAKLKRAVGAATFRKLCKEVMDKGKLEQAVQDGLVDIAVVAECSDEVARGPYVRITTK